MGCCWVLHNLFFIIYSSNIIGGSLGRRGGCATGCDIFIAKDWGDQSRRSSSLFHSYPCSSCQPSLGMISSTGFSTSALPSPRNLMSV